MKLSEVKERLKSAENLLFKLENGAVVPKHFHVTEVGLVTKNFIDCGGKLRAEKVANFQLWDANDYEHRLKPGKLLKIIELSEKVLGLEDYEVEVEYQTTTIGKYDLVYDGAAFVLMNKQTACLAKQNCGVPDNTNDAQPAFEQNSCTPGGGCC